MSEFETIFSAVLILCYGVMCYTCGKVYFMNLIALMLQQKAEEIIKNLEQQEGEIDD